MFGDNTLNLLKAKCNTLNCTRNATQAEFDNGGMIFDATCEEHSLDYEDWARSLLKPFAYARENDVKNYIKGLEILYILEERCSQENPCGKCETCYDYFTYHNSTL